MRSRNQNKVQTGIEQSFTPVGTGILQRKCALSNTPGLVKDRPERDEEELTMQRSPVDQAEPSAVPPIVHEVLRSPGQPLDAATRAHMEPRFGHDFSRVRVHTDAKAAESARAVNAQAYTVGSNIVFGAGQYISETKQGKKLLTHELVHIVQQAHSSKSLHNSLTMNDPRSSAEQEANAASRAVAQGQRFIVTSQENTGVSRHPSNDEMTERGRRQASRQPPGAQREDVEVLLRPGMVYMCSKSLESAPLAKHAFFRVGGSSRGYPTYSLEPVDRGNDCYQGEPMRDFPADFNADGSCIATSIRLSCLLSQFASYPVGHYCTRGPNSNTFIGHIARNCGISNPDPPGWTPGIDDSPPPAGTFAPSPLRTLFWCSTKECD